ncbi:hypothetical protein D4R99_00930 [bacterium]|nr:MAG: hypothetical protein D4R99_00930 [bacterium]
MKLTKKKIFWISLIGFVPFTLLFIFRDSLYDYCFAGGHCWQFWDSLDIIGAILFIFPFVFLFSLITYFLREEVFQAWLRFVKWWIPLSILLVLIMPDGQGGGYMPSLIDKQTIAFLMSSIFIFVSTVKIISKSIELRKK